MEAFKSPKPNNSPRINPHLIKEITSIVTTLIIYFQPEAAIAIALTRLVWIFLEELNQKGK